ncbi:hypothetical protein Lfu02_02600 [Longispora fulva]|uniref:Uncharacterized protein n=1 Tax=Longispora fulva TaxID=619741 RepID=A0A8J7GPZ4_9ACTN|nr:hypothetical protein [Longispora fulva]MBG6135868.1 hypothetical protein [Longispora fulva]GIG55888.1 hypothetical protein Lfu02_02600 [Longispora fulva]
MAGDNADMLITEMDRHATTLGTVGDDLDAAWSRAAERIQSAVTRLGLGPMGQRFAANYGPGHRRLGTDAPAAVADTARLAEAGRRSVLGYEQGQQAAVTVIQPH